MSVVQIAAKPLEITVIYRCCEGDTKGAFRPKHFSKINCLNNFLDVFRFNDRPKGISVNIIPVHDGPVGRLYDAFQEYDIPIEKINVNSNAKSLEACLDLASGLPVTDIIYFLEDDYLHTDDAVPVLVEGFRVAEQFNKSNIISPYLHTDRFVRTDDIDRGLTHMFLGNLRYWRTAESTTCTWAIKQDTYLNDNIYQKALKYGLNDREFFRAIRSEGTILFNPLHAASTHCHEPFMSPFVDWSNV